MKPQTAAQGKEPYEGDGCAHPVVEANHDWTFVRVYAGEASEGKPFFEE